MLRRTQTINDTKIQYLQLADKIYKVEKISFYYFMAEAVETDLAIGDIPKAEVWDITDLKEFKIRLKNHESKLIDLAEWKMKYRSKEKD